MKNALIILLFVSLRAHAKQSLYLQDNTEPPTVVQSTPQPWSDKVLIPKEAKAASSLPSKAISEKSTALPKARRHAAPEIEGNLPWYYRNRDFRRLVNTSAAIIVPDPNIKEELYQVHQGDELRAVIDHSIIAFPDETAPVIAKIRGGNLDGAKLIGESKLEPNTKRIFITFQTIVYHSKAYGLKANALNQDKQNGFEGEYHSNEGGLFAGDFISSTVAAYFDGLVPRQTNVFGGTTADSSVDSALKKGASGGAMASADRFKEKLKKTPQYAELEGPILIEVLMLSKAVEN